MANELEDIVRRNGAIPATIGIIDGQVHIGELYTVVWEKFTVGIFHVKKFHIRIFSSSWVNYPHLLPYLFNGKNISCVKFSS